MCQGTEVSRTKVTVHQFRPIYHTEIIATVQYMYADYVVWDSGSGGLLNDFFNGGWGSFNRKGQICFWEGESDNEM